MKASGRTCFARESLCAVMTILLPAVLSSGCPARGRTSAPAGAPSQSPASSDGPQTLPRSSSPSQAERACDNSQAVASTAIGEAQFIARVVAPTAVAISVTVGPTGRPPLAICAERWLAGRWGRRKCSEEGLGYEGRHGLVLVDAAPESEETYRAAIDPGTGSRGDLTWVPAIRIRTPPSPRAAPPAPDLVTAHAVSSHAAELAWEAHDDCDCSVYGFEILRNVGRDAGRSSDDYQERFPGRVAIVAAGTKKAIIHGLTPGENYAFRIRAFNQVGASPESRWQEVRLPPGASARMAREHISAFVYGVRLTESVNSAVRDVDYYVMCPGGTYAIARGDVDGELSHLTPPFGDSCQAWPSGELR